MATEAQTVTQGNPPERWVMPGLLVGVLAISFAAIFFRKTEPTHPLVAAGTRLAIAAILLSPWTFRSILKSGLKRSVVLPAVGAGALYGLHFGSWVTSLTMTSVAASVTIVTSTPLILAGVSLATGKDRPKKAHWIAMALALLGLGIIGGRDLLAGNSSILGDALALVGAISMAGYLLLARSLGPTLNPLAFTGFATTIGALFLFGVGLLSGVSWTIPSATAWQFLILAALIPQMVGHTLLTWALKYVSPTTVGLSTVGEPVGAALLAWFWLGETIDRITALGCSITLIAVIAGIKASQTPGKPEG